jgi:hypothetical protein
MDNCSRQNKNKFLLRLAAYLAKMNYFWTVEFVFYVCGHTKNACDRLFSQMKIRFHKDYVHSYRAALAILDDQPTVHIIDATEEVFKDFFNMIYSFSSTFENGTICVNHIFKVDKEEDVMKIQCYMHDCAEVIHQPMPKRCGKLGKEQLAALKAAPLDTLKPPGIREIKQLELSKKCRKYVDSTYWDMMCPEPLSSMMDQVKNDKLEKSMKVTEKQKALLEKRQEGHER